MASPQKENGYTAISNELFDVVVCTPLPGRHKDVVLFVIRKTYGYRKKKDYISLSQFVRGTRIDRSSVCRIIKDLVKWNLLAKEESVYSLNKNYETWLVAQRPLGSGVDATSEDNVKSKLSSGVEDNRVVACTPHTKETIQKKYISELRSLKKTMKKNKMGKYKEDGHNEYEEVIDLDTGEEVPDPLDEKEKINAKVTELLTWAEDARGKPFLDRPTQRKFIHTLRTSAHHPDVIKSTYLELLNSDYWRSQKNLPDFKTVFSALKNKR